ncbi:DUF1622 domain-containing protein [Frisingicoccus sp.]|uniref:DUF1622 domain-containing protein n=1 Tax=Frisingicoccus sp. TaxID=1918627 RepID=UPI002EA86736|nr:DUF1622 domain-containing protein [Frisingicoccus sp.]
MLEVLHHILYEVVEYGIIAFEIIGVAMLFWAGIKGLIGVAKKDHHVGLEIGESMALALQFLLGGEILRTVVIHDMNGVFLVGGIVVLRVALTLLISYENKHHRALFGQQR